MGLEESSPSDPSATSITLTFECSQFSREAALKTAYWFTRELYIDFPPALTGTSFDIILRPKLSSPTLEAPRPPSLDELASEFRNAMVDAQLRIQVQQETSGIRELLLAKAFAEAGVLESSPPGSFADPVVVGDQHRNDNLVMIDRSQTDEC